MHVLLTSDITLRCCIGVVLQLTISLHPVPSWLGGSRATGVPNCLGWAAPSAGEIVLCPVSIPGSVAVATWLAAGSFDAALGGGPLLKKLGASVGGALKVLPELCNGSVPFLSLPVSSPPGLLPPWGALLPGPMGPDPMGPDMVDMDGGHGAVGVVGDMDGVVGLAACRAQNMRGGHG